MMMFLEQWVCGTVLHSSGRFWIWWLPEDDHHWDQQLGVKYKALQGRKYPLAALHPPAQAHCWLLLGSRGVVSSTGHIRPGNWVVCLKFHVASVVVVVVDDIQIAA